MNSKMTSVCIVSDNDKNFMTRIADIIGNKIVIPNINYSEKFCYFNRSKLYFNKNETSLCAGDIGIWEWTVDEEGKRVYSTYLPALTPIEVIKTGFNKERLRESLIKGIKICNTNIKRLFVYSDEDMYGVLCDPLQMEESSEGFMHLKKDVYSLPCYPLFENDIVYTNLDKNEYFLLYKFLELPRNCNLFNIRVNEFVIKIICDSINKNFSNKFNINRDERRKLLKLIEYISNDDIYNNVSSEIHTSFEESKNIVNNIKGKIENFLTGKDIGEDILLGLLNKNENLRDRLREEYRAEFSSEMQSIREENSEMIKNNEEIRKKIEEEQKNLVQQRENLRADHQRKIVQMGQVEKDAEDRALKAQKIAEHYEQLGEKSLSRLREKLAIGRQESEEFLANFVLFGALERKENRASSLREPSSFLFQSGKIAENQEKVLDTEEVLETLEDNLKAVGATHETELAHFLYGAYQSRTPLLLAGPQGAAVVDAFSCAVTGCHASVLDCCGEWSPDALDTVLKDKRDVVIVKHPFLHRWIDQMVSELGTSGKMWVFVHPYADDLALEPTGLYSYVYPLVLDIFMTGRTSGSFSGCQRTNNFREAHKYEDVQDMVKNLKLFTRKPILKSMGTELSSWANAVSMSEREREFFCFACLIFPLAVAFDRKDILLRKIYEENNLSSIDKNLLESALGEKPDA